MKELFIFNPESYYSEDMKSLVSRDEFLAEFNEKFMKKKLKLKRLQEFLSLRVFYSAV